MAQTLKLLLPMLLGITLALPAVAAELVVSAAASLTNAFKEIGAAFEKTQPGDRVVSNFAASGPLLQQIENGAPVDVFASADQETMDKGEAKKLIVAASRRNFVSNRLVLVQPKGASTALRGTADLKREAVKRIAVGNSETVPVGRYTRDVLQAEGAWEALAPKLIYADSVRQVLDYVVRGEVDAGFVYATDAALAKDKVDIVAEIATRKPVLYPIAVVAGSKQVKLAESFVAFVSGHEAQAVLARYGFGRP
jgi:molybdate transport system substrate-binding protein